VDVVALGQVFLPIFQFSPVSIISPMFHTHPFIYHRRCMFFSQYFSFPAQYHSTNAPYLFIPLPLTVYHVFLPVLQFPPSVPFHQRSILVFIYMLLLPEGQNGETCKPSKNQWTFGNRVPWTGKTFSFLIGVTNYYKLSSVLKQTLRWINQVVQIITTTLFL
jgi:hypothetical protein